LRSKNIIQTKGHFWTEENGAFLILIFNQLQCATEFYNYLSLIGYLDQCDPFFSDQHVTFQFLRCSSCSNIPVILTVLFLTLYQSSKIMVATVATPNASLLDDLGPRSESRSTHLTSNECWLNFETVCGGLDDQTPDLSWGVEIKCEMYRTGTESDVSFWNIA